MTLSLHNLRPARGAKTARTRVGRGAGSGIGTYSGRGLKGQKARSGGKGGLTLQGMKFNIERTPKLGGFKSLRPKLEVVNIEVIEKNFAANEVITPAKLLLKGLVRTTKNGIKVLGMGKISKKVTLKVQKISESAKEAVLKAGGKVVLLSPAKKDDKSS